MTPRDTLLAQLAALEAQDAVGAAAQKTVELDQQAVGRLSRMDALQNQAMAQVRRRQGVRARIEAVLRRIEEGEYGSCTECGDAIESAWLDVDPAILRCLDCMRG